MTYRVTETSGDSWLLFADMQQASAPISYDYHQEPGSCDVTPYQTADARHDIDRAAALVLHYIDRGSCATAQDEDAECDCGDRIESVDPIEDED